jgi:hypothetical protein
MRCKGCGFPVHSHGFARRRFGAIAMELAPWLCGQGIRGINTNVFMGNMGIFGTGRLPALSLSHSIEEVSQMGVH